MATHSHYAFELARALESLGNAGSPTGVEPQRDPPPARLSNTPRYAEVAERIVRYVHAREAPTDPDLPQPR